MQKEFGITTIYVTHDQEEAMTLSDRIAVFNKGYIEQIGTPNEVYNFSKTEFVCNFLGDINRLSDELVQKLAAVAPQISPEKHNYIRLERVQVDVEPKEGQLVLRGRVISREFYGMYIKYLVDVGCQTLKVIEKNGGPASGKLANDINVVIDPNDVMAYEPGKEAEVAQ